jgi:glucose-6-phosphate isomerase
MISCDISNIWGALDLSDLLNAEQEVSNAHALLASGEGAGSDFLGWVRLPETVGSELHRIQDAAARIRASGDALVVIGIGGSYLGPRAAIELLKGQYYNLKPDVNKIFYCGNGLSTKAWGQLFDVLETMDFSVNVISKSGTTTEPAVAFRNLKWMLERKYGVDKAKEHIYVTTDPEKGALRQMATEEGYETFTIPPNVGGRYSVLSAVGLLPMAVAGVDIATLLSGALDAMNDLDVRSFDNPVWQYAAARNLLYRHGKKTELLASWEPDFHYFSRWWQQLFGESEGKDGKGIFPSYVEFTADLHSMGQMIQQGERTIFETMVRFAPPDRSLKVAMDWKNLDGLDYLADKELSYVEQQAYQGTVNAHVDGGVPVITLETGSVTESVVGELFYFFELACGVSAYMLGVNPFDQPGVEFYKRNMFQLLGKPGY